MTIVCPREGRGKMVRVRLGRGVVIMHYKGVIIMRYGGFGAYFIVNVTNTGIGHIFSGRKIPRIAGILSET